jgi:hypothetical protein
MSTVMELIPDPAKRRKEGVACLLEAAKREGTRGL